MKALKRWLAAALACGCALACAADLAANARLVLESGHHGAPVRRIALSANQRLLATASDDKTVRLWDAATQQLLHVLRAPIGDGAEGRMYGVAFDPAGERLAAGGNGLSPDAAVIHLFGADTGELQRSFLAGPGEVKRLVWSSDGRWIVAVFASPGAVRVFSPRGEQLAAVALQGEGYGLDVGRNGLVAATDTAGEVHLYQLGDAGALQPLRRIAVGRSTPVGVAVSPDASRLAVVHFAPERNGSVDLFALPEGRLLQTLRQRVGPSGRTQSVSWSRDGQRLAIGGATTPASVAGREAIEAVQGFVLEFDLATRGARQQIVASDAITDLARFDDGRLAYASFDSGWGSLSVEPGRHQGGERTRYVRRSDRLWLGPAEGQLAWQTEGEALPWVFELQTRQLHRALPREAAAPVPPAPFSGSANWESVAGATPRLVGNEVALKAGEISRAAARIGRSDDLVWGSSLRLARFGPEGRAAWQLQPGAEVRAVNSTADGRFVVAALADGTLRWFRASDGALLLSLFAPAASRWVVWAPSGHYDVSPGAEALVGWQLDAAPGRAGAFYSIGRFRQTHHRPDVIDRVLVDGDVNLALRHADESRRQALEQQAARPAPLPPAAGSRPEQPGAPPLPPTLVYKQSPQVTTSDGQVTLRFAVSHEAGEAPPSIVVRRNGTLQPIDKLRLPSPSEGWRAGEVTIEVPPGPSLVHVLAANGQGFSDALVFTVQRHEASAGNQPRPDAASAARAAAVHKRLFVLAVGVARYADASIGQLDFPAKDARDMASTFKAQHGRAYQQVELRVLTDQQATRGAVLAGLAWLASAAEAGDVAVLFLAGHAVNHPDGAYYFLPHDTKADQITTSSVDEGSIRSALVRNKGTTVVFIDTCHAGNVIGSALGFSRDLARIANDLASPENGVIVFAASTGRQESRESVAWGNGAFTKAVIGGLQGGADLMRRGQVTYQGLGYYVATEVDRLTTGRQTPVLISPPPGLPDFTLAIVGERATAARVEALRPAALALSR